MDSQEQESLVRRMQAGDTEAFGRLFESYGARLLRMAYLIIGNHADSEDIVQETFAACFFKCRELKDCSRFTPWLYRILARNAYRIGRRSRRELPLEEPYGGYAGGQCRASGRVRNAGAYGSQGQGQCGGPDSGGDAGPYGSLDGGRALWQEPAGESQPLDIVIEDETRREVWEAVQQLSLKLRTAVVLYYYNGLSTKEIAGITRTLEGTVKSRLHTARKILERKLKGGGTAE